MDDFLLDLPEMIPVEMDERALADFLGVAPSTIRTMARDKVAVRLKRGRYDVRVTLRNYLQRLRETKAAAGRPTTDETKLERTRLLRAQAEAQESKNRLQAGELVDAATVEREWAGVLRDVRAGMLALPSRVGAALPHLSQTDVALIDSEIRASLEGLADGNG